MRRKAYKICKPFLFPVYTLLKISIRKSEAIVTDYILRGSNSRKNNKLRPNGHSNMHKIKRLNQLFTNQLSLSISAEREGFEPPEALTSTVFKTAAFDHSAISPGTKVDIFFLSAKILQLFFHNFTLDICKHLIIKV